MDKRIESRRRINGRDKLSLEVFLPFPKGTTIKRDVLDLSDSGLSFRMENKEGFFHVGTPLKKMTIEDGSKTFNLSGEVIYARSAKENGNGFHRIGVRFTRRHSGSIGPKKYSFFPLRPRRFSADNLKSNIKIVLFTDSKGKTWEWDVLDFSRFGVSLSTRGKTPFLRIGQKLKDLKVIIGPEIPFSGDATIKNIRKENSKTTIGISFNSKAMDINRVLYMGKKLALEKEANNRVASFQVSGKIRSDFKLEVADLRFFLDSLETNFIENENELLNEPLEKKTALEKTLLEAGSTFAFSIINSSLDKMENTILPLSDKEKEIHKEFFRQSVHSLFLKAPFIARSFFKPLGYAGDYEMINILHRNGFEGEALLGKFLNKYACNLPAAKAVRNRSPFLVKQLNKLVKKYTPLGRNKIHVASVGCGPAQEIQEFMRQDDTCNYFEFTLIDSDKNALLYCQEKLLELKNSLMRKTRFNFLHKPIDEIIRGLLPIKHSQDMFYCVGLYDYLSDSVAGELTKSLMEALNPGGELILGNFDPGNTAKYQMENICEWYLVYRSKKNLSELAKKFVPGSRFRVISDPTKTNNYLILRKAC